MAEGFHDTDIQNEKNVEVKLSVIVQALIWAGSPWRFIHFQNARRIHAY
jgi:hypothetical protein